MILSVRQIHFQINVFYNNAINETNMYKNIQIYESFLMCIEKVRKKSSSNIKYKQTNSLIFLFFIYLLAYDMITEVN